MNKMSKSQINKCQAYLKRGDKTTSKKKEKKEVLHYADIQKINNIDYYVFTNGITAYAIQQDIGLPLFQDSPKEDKEKGYPALYRFFSDKEMYKPIELVNYKRLCELIKENSHLKEKGVLPARIVLDDKNFMFLNAMYLKEAYEILGKNDLNFFYKNSLTPLYIENINNNMGLICVLNPNGSYQNYIEIGKM